MQSHGQTAVGSAALGHGVAGHRPFYGEASYPADAELVRTMSVDLLIQAYEAMLRASEAFDVLYGGEAKSEAFLVWMEEFEDRFSRIRTYLMEELERRPMTGDRLEDDRRIGYIMDWAFHRCGCGSDEAVAKMQRLREASAHAGDARGAIPNGA